MLSFTELQRKLITMLFFNCRLKTTLSFNVDDIVLIDQHTLWVLYLYTVVRNSKTRF